MKKSVWILILGFISFFMIIGCGGGGGGGGSCPSDVSGTYTFITDEGQGSCSDGSSGTFSPISMRIPVVQDGNWITFGNPPNIDTPIAISPDVTVIDATIPEGALESDCDFVVDFKIWTTMEDFSGYQTVNYYFYGTFTDSGWYGTYEFSMNFHDYSVTCDFIASFDGSKSTTSSALNEMELNEIDKDIVESDEFISVYEMIGRLVGY